MSEVDRLLSALAACIDDLKEWGGLALSSDYSGRDDPEYLAAAIARHQAALDYRSTP